MPTKKGTPKTRMPRSAKQATQQRNRRRQSPLFRQRLEKLISENGGSRNAFAKLIGVETPHVSKWCNEGVMPGGEKLRTIAKKTNVSVDWLLGFDVPQYRGEDRSKHTLEIDLAHLVARGVTNGLNSLDNRYDASMIEVDGPRLLAECVAQGVEDCFNHRTAMLKYTVLAHSVTGASADLFILGEALASTLTEDLQVGLGRAVAEQRRAQEHASEQLAQLSALVAGNRPIRWSRHALWPEVKHPSLHVLEWMNRAEPDQQRMFNTEPFLAASGQPTLEAMARQMAGRGGGQE